MRISGFGRRPRLQHLFIPFGLAAPFIIGLNLLLALFWIIRWKPIAFLPVLLLAIGYGVVSRHIQLPVLKQYEKRTSADIDVTTYNVHIFRDADWNGSIDSIAKYIKTTDPDILAIQEYYASSSMPADTIGTIMGGYPYFKTFYIRSEPGSGVGYGLAPIQPPQDLAFGRDSLREREQRRHVCRHDNRGRHRPSLQLPHADNGCQQQRHSPRGGVENESQIEMKAGLKRIMGKLRNNGIKRAAQADIVAGYVQSSPYPVILCGDFNDVPASYTYKKLSQGLKDGFKAAGRGYAHSFRELHSLFNVDYVFYTPTSFRMHTL